MSEWRVFLPEVHTDDYWIPRPMRATYSARMQKLQLAIENVMGTNSREKREDCYHIGTDEVGLKSRGGKKFEMKVCTSRDDIGVESWAKTKYGAAIDDAETLVHMNRTLNEHHIDGPLPEGFPVNCHKIGIMKHRCIHTERSSSFEACSIVITSVEVPNWDYMSSRRWISVCVEGVGDHLREVLQQNYVREVPLGTDTALLPLVVSTVQQAYKIFTNLPGVASVARFFPVVSGFPSWVCRLAMEPEELNRFVHLDMQQLPQLLAFVHLPLEDPTTDPELHTRTSPAQSVELGRGRPPEDRPVNMYRYALVMCRNNEDKFLCVLETRNRGWWMPGGMVSVGESVIDGAFREVMEEAGIPIRLQGVLQVQEEVKGDQARLRIIFYAEPIDDRAPKAFPDEHSERAEWLSLNDIRALNLRNKLRSREPLDWAEYLSRGEPIAAMSFYSAGEDGYRSPPSKPKIIPLLHLPSQTLTTMSPSVAPMTPNFRPEVAKEELPLPEFIQACRTGNLESVIQFLRLGVPVNFADHEKGWTPLHHAIKGNGSDAGAIVEQLLRYGADPSHTNVAGRNAMHFAARHDRPDILQTLVEFCDQTIIRSMLEQRDKNGSTPFDESLTSSNDCEQIIRLMI